MMLPAHERMIEAIREEVRVTSQLTGRDSLRPEVMKALMEVPRHEFVPAELLQCAYDNSPLPIGHGQTISQPYIVALMTDLLEPRKDATVLEIGTGCGYQAAILGKLFRRVYSVEYVPELAARARKHLDSLGYDNVEIRVGNGYEGWPEHAPFDAIIVTAAPESVPPTLVEQLKRGGRMAIPVGSRWCGQNLLLVRKDERGIVHEQDILPVAFVPMVNPPAGH